MHCFRQALVFRWHLLPQTDSIEQYTVSPPEAGQPIYYIVSWLKSENKMDALLIIVVFSRFLELGRSDAQLRWLVYKQIGMVVTTKLASNTTIDFETIDA
jgi:hypothetical protein